MRSSFQLIFNQRFGRLLIVAARLAAQSFSERIWLARRLTPGKLRQVRAARLRKAVVDLGPTFIKIGQFLSTRADILPAELANELALLQDKVPPVSLDLVRKTIMADLGKAPEDIFYAFEPEPIASASIGQVHRAWLADGSPVVLKVQRPDLLVLFKHDLSYMRFFARSLYLVGKADHARAWLALADAIDRTLVAEIDYIREGKNADALRAQLRHDVRVKIPRVYWQYTGRRVLTLEYLPGIKIDQVNALRLAGISSKALGKLLVKSYLDQFFKGGFYHADPHPGNLAVDLDGNLILYDFGMVGQLDEHDRESLKNCVLGVVLGDAPKVVKHLVELGAIRNGSDMELAGGALKSFFDYYNGMAVEELDIDKLEADLTCLLQNKALTMPVHLAYLLKTGSSVEGVARTLHPNFSFVEAAKPALRNWVVTESFQKFARVLPLAAAREFFQDFKPSSGSDTKAG